MTESSETKLCRLCGCDSIDNKNIFDESEELLIKLRTTFCIVVSTYIEIIKVFYYRFVDLGRSLFYISKIMSNACNSCQFLIDLNLFLDFQR